MKNMAAARGLVLFDIDGTLIRRAGPHHRDALTGAIREVTGHETSFDGIPTSGMLDRDLIRILLSGAGAAAQEVESWLPAIIERAQATYQLVCPALEDSLCPGVRDLLERIRQAGIATGLVTGNLTAIGWKKM
jgi:phosphoglycolate phosphatase